MKTRLAPVRAFLVPRSSWLSRALTCVALYCGFWSTAAAQGTGTIAGRVVNKATGVYLAGAEIRLPDNRTFYADSAGRFEIAGVPAGDVQLTASYAGLDASTVDVKVGAGQRATVDIALTSADYAKADTVVKLD